MKTSAHPVARLWLIYLGLGLITLCLYLPALSHGFVEYDDQQYVTDNPRVQAGLTWSGLVWAFGFHAGNWHPLAWLSHMLDCQLFAAWAGGHHLTSVLLHVASTLLLFAVLNRMTNAPWRSAAVAALFAWHPLHVESVAWVAERKDVLCAFFWMLTLWLYVRYALGRNDSVGLGGTANLAVRGGNLPPRWAHGNRTPFGEAIVRSTVRLVARPNGPAARSTLTSTAWFRLRTSFARYLLTLGALALCLMAKPMGVTLPFILLLLDYWPLGRVAGDKWQVAGIARLVVEKIPFFALSALACVLTLRAQELAIVSTAGLSVSQRLAHVMAAYDHYLIAMFIPRHLAVYYPYQLHLPAVTLIGAIVVLTLITLLAIRFFRSRPWLMVGWLWYLGTLVPVIGLVQVGDQAWADRYTYLPLIGLFMAVVWCGAEFIQNRRGLQSLTVLVAVAMLALTSRQLRHWQNTRTLFTHADQVTPNNYMAVTVLGSLLAKEHKLAEAMACYQTALRYQPGFPEAHFFLGNALDEQGRLAEAVAEYQKALWFRPTQEQTHIFMGIALGKQKKYEEAMAHYNAALKLNPDSAVAQNNLARLLHTQGRFEEAIAHYQAALEIDPKLELAHNNLGVLLLQKGSVSEGTRQLREALRLKPGNAETGYNLALALNQQAQWSEAAGLFTNTLSQHLHDPKAHYEYGVALGHLQRTREAMSQYASALLIQPDFPDALDGLAWILSTAMSKEFRNGTEAVKMAERACELTGRHDAVKLKTLAAAYAEAGQFEAATKTLQIAQELATKATLPALVQECSLMLEQFHKTEPWRSQ